MLAGFAVLGYSYMNDIKECKGRVSRKKYPLLCADGSVKRYSELKNYRWAIDRIEKGDPNWTKYLEHKPRAVAHH